MFPLYDLNPHRRVPLVTVAIIVVNLAVMILLSGLSNSQANLVAVRYGFLPVRANQAGSGRPIVLQIPIPNQFGQVVKVEHVRLSTDAAAVYSTILTAMFLHGGWGHVLSNMWILWIFGNNIEDRLGHLMYVLYYLVGGTAATLCHWAVQPQSQMPVIGASGAVAAVLGGYALSFPWAKIRTLIFIGLVFIVDVPALVWLGIWFVGQNVIPGLLSLNGVQHAPIAYWAHIGGFVAGVVLMPVMSLGASPPEADWRKEVDEMFRFDDSRTRLQ